MFVRRSRFARRTRLGVFGALLAALSLLLTLPATAQPAPADTPAAPERGDAHLGMGVLAHDGQGGRPGGSLAATTEGVDVSGHQGSVDWGGLWNSGVKWAYVKATESTTYQNESFTQQYNGSYDIGMIRGAYHFATPDTASGAAQANYFVDHGGGWSKDGRTLPGVLDIEWNPYGEACYGMAGAPMVNWIADFLNTYKARTGRDAVIYTATSWWTQCTGNSAAFGATNPLWIARYNTAPGELPAGWGTHTMWQYTSTGPIVGDHDQFNGALDRVVALANG
ncbi:MULTISPECIES: lysozyme [Streptomyces]|uniref:Lysozyme n=1 Tax=Streptomyces albus (strain ATCC 21838 / DSM 41398 / FERM P-419 / JCM 4703 / NBRC 107858) TaxID=1081613 RepID=A0A0B5EJF4_STRA4|nr:lysozyme [Streptomyces sp. SCSIO ZS0520]AJE82378.1 secreted hydrolase [Streptomyces albus]AOU76693.1 secreted hydrolase [Streptomyces albus]AYN32473.1 lysozyme [Streptomyces albus]